MTQATKRTAARNLEIYRRFVAGETLGELADAHELGRGHVNKICREVEKDIIAEAVVEVTAVKKLETAKLEVLFLEAMRGWQRSMNPRERRRVRTVKKGEKEKAGKAAEVVAETAELVTEGRDGNPRFLEVAVKVRSDIRRIWGADAVVDWLDKDLQDRALVTTLQHQAAIADEQARQNASEDFTGLCAPRNRIAGHVSGNGDPGQN